MAATANCDTGRVPSCPPLTAGMRRYRAVSMQLAAYLDDRYVELHILTDAGDAIAVACPRDSIFALQQHIEQIGRRCPEIAGWSEPRAVSGEPH